VRIWADYTALVTHATGLRVPASQLGSYTVSWRRTEILVRRSALTPSRPPPSRGEGKTYDADRIRERIEAQGAAPNIPAFRRVATRFEKLAANYLAMVNLASLRIWLRVHNN